MLYTGEYNHNMDTKGRIIVPAKLRESLGATFHITKGIDGCLDIYDDESWTAFTEKLTALPSISNPAVRKLVRFFLAGETTCEVDSQGRVLIPASLRTYAGITKQVTFAGVGGKIEIWDTEKYNALMAEDQENMEELAEGLDIEI